MSGYYALGWLCYIAATDQYSFVVRGSPRTLRAVAAALAPLCQVADHFIDGDSHSLIVVLEREYAFNDDSAERTLAVIVATLLRTVDEPAPTDALAPFRDFIESIDFERAIED